MEVKATNTKKTIKVPYTKGVRLFISGILEKRDLLNMDEDSNVIIKDVSFPMARRIISYTNMYIGHMDNFDFVKSGDIDHLEKVYNTPEDVVEEVTAVENNVTTEEEHYKHIDLSDKVKVEERIEISKEEENEATEEVSNTNNYVKNNNHFNNDNFKKRKH